MITTTQKIIAKAKAERCFESRSVFCIIDVKEWDALALIPALLDAFDKWFYIYALTKLFIIFFTNSCSYYTIERNADGEMKKWVNS
ncbi:hypothetical protein [Sediminibacillus halophilus]|uniref:hypothetical protein n=1 Tax=Sediminibacillus halophilus TaxID=482461 RepID=UPI00094556D6|nr:hypothetical protein [Sediminibacillus halophilus]